MAVTISIVAPGNMGASIGQQLTAGGAAVTTLLEGRSAATVARAKAAGMTGATLAEIAGSDLILSIVPPNEAESLAKAIADAAAGTGKKGILVDCNAIAPQTVRRIGTMVEKSGLSFVDGSIIGLPASPGKVGPGIFVSGPQAAKVRALAEFGADVHVLEGPVGNASALKMCYGGITKGLIALGSMMILGAERFGASAELRDELMRTQPDLYNRFSKAIPDMFPKAGRWVSEMDEISTFLGMGNAEAEMFQSVAKFYRRLASESGASEIQDLAKFFAERENRAVHD